jgi:hypothetical protein
MRPEGPLALVLEITAKLDELSIPYVLGGSVASSLFGEPRATADVDFAVHVVDVVAGERLIDGLTADFYVPVQSARLAIREGGSFNVLATDETFKIDFFLLGDELLDRMQLMRRVLVPISDTDRPVWVTSAEDQILRKLDWYRRGGSVSERQWRDVVSILLVREDALDRQYLHDTADALGLRELLDAALADAAEAQ